MVKNRGTKLNRFAHNFWVLRIFFRQGISQVPQIILAGKTYSLLTIFDASEDQYNILVLKNVPIFLSILVTIAAIKIIAIIIAIIDI